MITLHPGQQKVLNDSSKKKLVIVGARWGKSTLAIEMAIVKCIKTPGKLVQLYVAQHDRVHSMVTDICHALVNYELEFATSHNQITFPNGSTILVNVPMKGDIIFDDAFDGRDVTMIFTPCGWMKHQAPSTENPLVNISDDIQNAYSRNSTRI